MKTLLDPHQIAAVQACQDAVDYQGCQRQLVQMATGSGKTRFAAAFASQYLLPDQRFIYIAHREEILTRAQKEFRLFFPTDQEFGTIQAKTNEVYKQHLFAMMQTLQDEQRLRQVLQKGGFDLVLVDECHHAPAATWKRTIEALMGPATVHIGMTATAMRSDRLSLRSLYDDCVYSIGMLDLIAQEPPRLCNLRRIKVVVPDLHLKGLVAEGAEDFNEKKLAKAVMQSKVRHNLAVEAIHRYGPRDENGELYPGLYFGVDVHDANEFARVANAAGISTEVIHGKTLKIDRQNILKDFEAGVQQCIANVMVYTEGTDLPHARWAVIGRHTRSQSLYVQMVGRVCRLLPDEYGVPYALRSKQEALIFDLCDNEHTVLTLPDLVGISDERMGNKSVRELVKEKVVRNTNTPPEIEYVPGSVRLRVSHDSIFTSRQWKAIGSDKAVYECTSPGIGKVVVERRDFGGYTAWFESEGGKRLHIQQTPTQVEHAFGAGELYLHEQERKRAWKVDHANDLAPQSSINRLRLARFPISPNARLTNAQVAELWAQKAEAKAKGTSWHAMYMKRPPRKATRQETLEDRTSETY